jgi:8-oxo-dGTP pyrophosphatase MutT (NUDIX family)
MFRLPPPKLQRWRRVRCEPVASFRIFEVCRVELQDAAGRPRGDAFTVRGNDWCNVVAVTPDDHVVLVWQYRFGTDALSLEIPGGVIDPGESPDQAARRELREETGYEADRLDLLVAIDPNPAIQNNRCFTFVAQGARVAGATGFDLQEELETALLPATRIPELLDGGQVTHSLVQMALENYWRKRSADELERLVTDLEGLQRRKVLDLARRLRPRVTLEDVANPHDFPELGDPDWKYEDGMLAGIQTVLAAVRARQLEQKG